MLMGGSRGGTGGPDPGKSQVAGVVLKNTGTNLLRKPWDPSGPSASQGRFIHSSVKYYDAQNKKTHHKSLTEFSGSAHDPGWHIFSFVCKKIRFSHGELTI